MEVAWFFIGLMIGIFAGILILVLIALWWDQKHPKEMDWVLVSEHDSFAKASEVSEKLSPYSRVRQLPPVTVGDKTWWQVWDYVEKRLEYNENDT